MGAGRQRMATRQQAGAFPLADLDVARHRGALCVAHERSHLHALVEPVAHAQRLHALDEFLDKRVVHALVDHDAAGGGAPLPGRPEPAPQAALHGQLELRVVHDHDDVLAAHFEVHLLEARARRSD